MPLLEIVPALMESTVRMLRPGEHIPFEVGFPSPDPDWVWVEVKDGSIIAALFVAPCHGMVNFIHLKGTATMRLLRRVVRDCRKRGYQGYYSALDPSRPEEEKLMEIMQKGSAYVYPGLHIVVGGLLADLEKW